MENRFSFRDLVIAVLLIAVIVVVVLAMFQYDRQWTQLKQLKSDMDNQAGVTAEVSRNLQRFIGHTQQSLADIQAQLKQGVNVNPSAGNEHASAPSNTGTATAALSGVNPALGPPVGANEDPFKYIDAARKMPGYTLGDDFVRSFSVAPPKLTPLLSSDVYGAIIQDYVLQSLAVRDQRTFQWRPLVAKYWQISKDGLRIEFQLRRGVCFSDGQPLTADDVVFTYQWIMNPAVEDPRQKAYYDRIKNVVKINKYRVAFIYAQPYFKAFELAATMSILPRHFYSKFTPEQFNNSVGLLLGSGAYRLPDPKDWRPNPGQPIELVRNENYWGPSGPFDHIIIQIIQNETARYTTFLNGQLDVFGATPEQERDMLKNTSLLQTNRHYEFFTSDAGYRYIGWNERRNGKPTVFADKHVRQALTMLIDRQSILQQVDLGYGQIITGPFNPLTPQGKTGVKPWPYSPTRALALLHQAGFTQGNGELLAPDGKPFQFTFTYPSNSPQYERIALLLKDAMAQVGIQMTPRPTEWSVLLQDLNQRSFDAVMLGWSGEVESDPYQIFHSSQIKPPGDDFVSYSNPQLDKLIDQARATVDEPARMKLWHQVAAILHEDQPYTFLEMPETLYWLSDRFQNVQRTKLGLNSALEWWVPAGARRWLHADTVPAAPR